MSTRPSAASSFLEPAPRDFADDLADALTRSPRQIPSHYLYDDLGSSLFDAICELPWYAIARTEQRLLRAHAISVFDRQPAVTTLVELGPGSGDKLLTLMRGHRTPGVTIHLVDVSRAALDKATHALAAAPALAVVTHQATYEEGLAAVGRSVRAVGRTVVAFLGSNIGNFDPSSAASLLRSIRCAVRPGDALLMGTDLVKPESDLLLAYDDPLGVTAAFNRNLLVRVNRELGGDFDLHGFTHRAVWNAAASRVEMYLVSQRRQRVQVPAAGLDITFQAAEPIWTESSCKYRVEDLAPMLGAAGFVVARQWVDSGFALTLADAV